MIWKFSILFRLMWFVSFWAQEISPHLRRGTEMRDVFAGVDAGGTRIKIGLVHQSGLILSSEILRTSDCIDVDSFLRVVSDGIRGLAGAASVQVAGVGVGCPGRVDFEAGSVLWLKSKLEFLEGVFLAERLSERLGCSVVCDNDANAILTGEARYGSARGYRDVVAITVGTGIGGALMIDGGLVRGRNWSAGHFGYMSVDPFGPRHVCGNTGIFEEYASQSGIQRQVRIALEAGEASLLTSQLALGEEPDVRKLFEAADVGDLLGSRLANHFISGLGVLIANLIYALDPEIVLLGGGVINHRPGIIEALRSQVAGRLNYLPPNATEILPMALGDTAGIVGGASLAMDAAQEVEQGVCR